MSGGHAENRVTIALPAPVAIAAVAAVGVIIALLVLLLIGIGRVNSQLNDTNARLRATEHRVRAVGDAVDPLRRAVPPELVRIAPAVRAMRRDVDTVATDSLPAIETQTRSVTRAVAQVVADLDAADLPAIGGTLDRLARPLVALLSDGRVDRLVTDATDLLALLERRDVIDAVVRGVRAIPHLDTTVTDVGTTVQAIRGLVTDMHGMLATSLEVQCVALRSFGALIGLLPETVRPATATPAGCVGLTAQPQAGTP